VAARKDKERYEKEKADYKSTRPIRSNNSDHTIVSQSVVSSQRGSRSSSITDVQLPAEIEVSLAPSTRFVQGGVSSMPQSYHPHPHAHVQPIYSGANVQPYHHVQGNSIIHHAAYGYAGMKETSLGGPGIPMEVKSRSSDDRAVESTNSNLQVDGNSTQ
jgi:hypothetical protein